jgi:hypothetical protein
MKGDTRVKKRFINDEIAALYYFYHKKLDNLQQVRELIHALEVARDDRGSLSEEWVEVLESAKQLESKLDIALEKMKKDVGEHIG